MIGHLALVALLAAPLPVPPPTSVGISIVTWKGSGCVDRTGHGSTVATISGDRQAVTVTYGTFDLASDTGKKQTKRCDITIKVDVPDNMTFAVGDVIHRGFASLQGGATATLSGHYHITGGGSPGDRDHALPLDTMADFQINDPLATSPKYLACGKDRKIDIKVSLSIEDKNRTGSIVMMDATDSSVYQLIWKSCP